MQINSIVCDVKDCKTVPQVCQSFSIFKKRITDGAGSGEDVYWKFDLCQRHIVICMHSIINTLWGSTTRDILYTTPEDFFKVHEIKARVE